MVSLWVGVQATAVRVAIEENKEIDNIFMLGFDIQEKVKLTMYIKIQTVI